MARAASPRLWLGRLTFLAVALVLIFLRLLPLDTMPRDWAPPDLLEALTLAVVARRPDHLPMIVVALLFLLTDILFHRPPGLYAALMVITTEMLRKRAAGLRAAPFGLEWATVAVMMALLAVANRVALALVATPQAPLRLTLIELAFTILCYPLVVLIAYLVFGMRRPAPGEVDALGHKI